MRSIVCASLLLPFLFVFSSSFVIGSFCRNSSSQCLHWYFHNRKKMDSSTTKNCLLSQTRKKRPGTSWWSGPVFCVFVPPRFAIAFFGSRDSSLEVVVGSDRGGRDATVPTLFVLVDVVVVFIESFILRIVLIFSMENGFNIYALFSVPVRTVVTGGRGDDSVLDHFSSCYIS